MNIENAQNNVLPRFRARSCWGLQSLPHKMSPRHLKCCACHTESSCPKSNMTTVSQNEIFDPSKASSKFTKHCACHEKWSPKPPFILTNACHVCHTDENVSDHKTFGREPSEDTISCETSPENRRWRNFCAARATKFAGHRWDHLEGTPGLNPYRKNPKCVHTVWGKHLQNFKHYQLDKCPVAGKMDHRCDRSEEPTIPHPPQTTTR